MNTFNKSSLKVGRLRGERETIFNTILGNSALRQSLFGNIQDDDLDEEKSNKKVMIRIWASDLNNSLYQFLKVK